MKNIYFISDAHLGSLALSHGRQQERRLVRFLDQIKDKADAVYMMGDMFDFWYEYRYVVPKGYTRFLGKVSELTDLGVEVHYFTGNHDIWSYGYLEKECGVTIHREPCLLELHDKLFYLAHGDGLGDPNRTFKVIRTIFHSRFCQFLYSLLPTCWSMRFGLLWANSSMQKHRLSGIEPYMGENEHLLQFAKAYLQTHSDVNYFVFGHRHIELDLKLAESTRMLILGDWIDKFTYAVFDGVELKLERYIEGETRP